MTDWNTPEMREWVRMQQSRVEQFKRLFRYVPLTDAEQLPDPDYDPEAKGQAHPPGREERG